jgi:4-hydroxy-4-methyl-2-oxoglutarate aldolase
MTITQRLSACYIGAVHDVMRERGFRDFTLPPDIRPVVHGRGMAGPAFTIAGRTGPGIDPHQSLLSWTGFLSRAPSEHVIVCQAQ